MTLLGRFSVVTCILFVAASVAQSAMIYDINLYNATGRAVDLMYRKGSGKWTLWATIPPNHA